jgi:DNA-binding MarR family transcriptional regulator
LYKELVTEFPQCSQDAIDVAIRFMRAATRNHVRQEAILGRFGLSPGRFAILLWLYKTPKRTLGPSDLAKRLNVSRGTMTQFLDHLEKENLVERQDDPGDRRAMFIHLTDKGLSLFKKVFPLHLEQLELIAKILNRTERKQFATLLDKLDKNMPPVEIDHD